MYLAQKKLFTFIAIKTLKHGRSDAIRSREPTIAEARPQVAFVTLPRAFSTNGPFAHVTGMSRFFCHTESSLAIIATWFVGRMILLVCYLVQDFVHALVLNLGVPMKNPVRCVTSPVEKFPGQVRPFGVQIHSKLRCGDFNRLSFSRGLGVECPFVRR